MKIFDCFMFNNELDLLELRITELYDYVDIFVIIESDLSFTCRPKPFLFEQAKNRFQKWDNKIRYVKHQSLSHSNPWINENAQRNAIEEAISDADVDDIIIISDVDEIVRPKSIQRLLTADKKVQLFGFHMPLFNFKFNFMRTNPGEYDIWGKAARAQFVRKTSPQFVRSLDLYNIPTEIEFQKKPKTFPYIIKIDKEQIDIIHHGGWHFSYLGNTDQAIEKAKNTSHQEDITPSFLQQLDIEKSIKEKKCWDRSWPYNYEIVNLDEYFPKSCGNYPQHCLPDSGIDLRNLVLHCE